MKTKLITVVLFLLTYQLNAQFHLKVSMDEEGLYSVKLKSEVTINPGSIWGSGQISLTAPPGGFKLGDITSINGLWNNRYDFIGEDYHYLDNEYFFIGLKDGAGLTERRLSANEEITLITFRNVGECTGPIEIVSPTDPIIFQLGHGYCANCTSRNNPANDISVFDALVEKVYKFSDTYDTGAAICNPYYPPYSPITEIVKLELDKKGPNHFVFRWAPISNTSFYEVKIRQKGRTNWEKKLISTTPFAYFYSPSEGDFEYQVIAHEGAKVTKSKIVKFSNASLTYKFRK